MTRKHEPEKVILLHGMTMSDTSMKPIADRVEAQGYQTINVDYLSTKHEIQDLGQQIAAQTQEHFGKGKPPVHIVAHSMGGLVAKHMVSVLHNPPNLKTVEMLGTPNRGSEYADLMESVWGLKQMYEMLLGPAARQLTTYYNDTTGMIKAKVGVIAGSMPILFSSFVMGDIKHDGVVSVESTKFPGAEHIIVHTDHMSLLTNPEVHAKVLKFLRDRTFADTAPALDMH